MPLNASILATLIKSKVTTAKSNVSRVTGVSASGSVTSTTEKVALTEDDMYQAIAEAVIEHITTAGIVTVTVSTAGTAAAQTGGGTGTIK